MGDWFEFGALEVPLLEKEGGEIDLLALDFFCGGFHADAPTILSSA